MSRGYLQVEFQFPNAKNGSFYVYVAGGTFADYADVFDPISGAVLSQPLTIDSDGYAQAFHVDSSINYDILVKDFNGVTRFTRQNAAIIGGGSSTPGPQGEDGPPGESIVGPPGEDGKDGAPGVDGQDGVDGVDGQDGDGLYSIYISNEETGEISYTKTSDPTAAYVAGNLFPGGVGRVKNSESDSLDFLPEKIVAGDGIAISLDETNRLKFDATSMNDHKVQAHMYSTQADYAGTVLQAGTGIDISLTPDLNRLVIKATGTAVGGFYWKGAWDELTAYNSNNAVWFFDNTVTPVVNRLYIAMEPNQGINPVEDTSGIWSEMMRVDTLGDMFVAVDEDDLQTGYLIDKIRNGSGIAITRHTDSGGDAYLAINSTCLYSVTIGGVTKHSTELAGNIFFSAEGGSVIAWDGNHVKISSVALGETSSTAYRGDRGKIAYDHSQTSGNPHGTDFSELENKPTTLAGYGITDAMSTANGAIYADDWNNFTTTGVYTVINWSGANGPIAGTYPTYRWGQLVVYAYNNVITQIYYPHRSGNSYFRVYHTGEWGDWRTSAPTNYGNVDSSTNWNNLTSTGKYRVLAVSGSNGPSTAYSLGVLLVDYASDDYIQQTYYPTYGNGTPVCRQLRDSVWGHWRGSISGGTGMSLNTQIHYQSVTAPRTDPNAIYLCY